jgi:hypothetical protein
VDEPDLVAALIHDQRHSTLKVRWPDESTVKGISHSAWGALAAFPFTMRFGGADARGRATLARGFAST